jgi:hypothetical protein
MHILTQLLSLLVIFWNPRIWNLGRIGAWLAVSAKQTIQVRESRGEVAAEASVVRRVKGNTAVERNPIRQKLVP